MNEDIEVEAVYSGLLTKNQKIIGRKNVSVKHAGEYMRWIASTLSKSFDAKRRVPYRLLCKLVPMLLEAAELAEKAQDDNKYHQDACNVLLCGFGLRPEVSGSLSTTKNQNKKGKGRRPAALDIEIVNRMDELISNKKVSSIREAARVVAKAFKIGESTARRYYKDQEDIIKNYHS